MKRLMRKKRLIEKKRLIRKKQLLKKSDFGDGVMTSTGDFFAVDTGSMTNFVNYAPYAPLGMQIPDLQDKFSNNKVTKMTYGPTISREWKFEAPNDHAEWLMRDLR